MVTCFLAVNIVLLRLYCATGKAAVLVNNVDPMGLNKPNDLMEELWSRAQKYAVFSPLKLIFIGCSVDLPLKNTMW